MRSGITTRNPDNQCCGQVYLEMYDIEPQEERLTNVTACISNVLNDTRVDDWSWVDTLHMAMPVYAKLGVLYENSAYFDKMYELYEFSKNQHGDAGLYSRDDHLWWRDADFDPPYTEPNGEDCYWSRGNGWVFAALARTLDVLPTSDPHRDEYIQDFRGMAAALKIIQRDDGFWNVSLHDPDHFGGPETSGTAFFVYGLAWGLNSGLLSVDEYESAMLKGWHAIADSALHDNGFLGYMQGTGKEPSAGQPVTYDSIPDFEDFGLGAFLLAGSELYKRAL